MHQITIFYLSLQRNQPLLEREVVMEISKIIMAISATTFFTENANNKCKLY